ncbi:sporulation protein YqfD [Bacillus massiliglaciei]|uniref:sporulation protein YqfD n=1 Tax=Bacillus massiliglaciei TaxID=1816693 RepID=UPI000DA5F370|nr:sporulation protein YqfD [Bacillus massiliglaciei]
MKNQWVSFYTGHVKVKAYGVGTERLINQLIRRGIHVWDVKRAGENSIIFHISLREITRLRQTVRKSDCKIEFIRGEGLPFLWKRVLKNSGFLVGFAAFILCIFVLSNMVWGIKIHEAEPETEHAIRKELDSMGVKIGKMQFLVDDVDTIQRKLTDQVDELTWVGVELKGTTYHLRVVEKQQPEEPEKTSPQNLVATKKAVVTDMFIEKGNAKVNVNDYVKKGQLLVSGVIGNEKNKKIVPAKGTIKGQTWYRATATVPLKTRFSVFDGEEYRTHSLKVGSLSIPVWGFKKPEYKDSVTETSVRPFHFLQWKLPIAYKVSTVRSKEDIIREYTKEEAVEEGKKMAAQKLEKRLGGEAEISGEKILHERLENGKVKLSIHYQVIEDIAKGQPIIQGD